MSLANLNFVAEKRPTPTYRATSEERRRQAVLEAIQVQKHLLAVDLGQQAAPLIRHTPVTLTVGGCHFRASRPYSAGVGSPWKTRVRTTMRV